MHRNIKLFLVYFFCFIWCFHAISQSQDSKKDKQELLVDSLTQKGYDLWIKNPSESVRLGEKAFKLALNNNYQEGAAFAKRVSGVAHWALGAPKEALFDLYEGLELYKKIKDLEGISNMKLNIGMVYADINEDSIAIQQFDEAIIGFTQLNLDSRIATTYTKLGTLQLENNNLDEAQINISNALKIHTRNDFKYGISEAHNRLGKLYLKQKNFEKADYHLRKSLKISNKIDDKDGFVNNILQYGKLYRLKKEYELADTHFKIALHKSKELSLNSYRLETLRNFAKLKKEILQSDSALFYYQQYINLKDSIFTLKKARQISGLEFRNEIKYKNQELEKLSQSKRFNRIIQWILVSGISIILALSFFLIKGIKNRSETQKNLLKQQQIIAQKELENKELKNKDLKQELDLKNRTLTSYAMNFVQKGQILESFKEIILKAKQTKSIEETNKVLSEMEKMIKINQGKEKDWEDFKFHFENVNPRFFERLKEKYPNLSANDLKVAALTKLNLSIKEASNILGISPESTKTARYRLRKKINLPSEIDLFEFLMKI